MIISFIRHGESENNILRVLSSNVSEPYKLTKNGEKQIKAVALNIREIITSVYASPLPRTIQSAKIILENLNHKPDFIVDDRIAEIKYGRFSGKYNSKELDNVREKQVAGNYEIRFGGFGENKREIMFRICNFLLDLIKSYGESDHIIVVSHGTIISMTESLISQINKLQNETTQTHNAAVKSFTLSKSDYFVIQQIINELNNRRNKEIQKRVNIVKNKFKYFSKTTKEIQNKFLQNFLEIAKNEVDNIELSTDVLKLLTDGFYKSDINLIQKQINKTKLDKNDVTLICAFKNAKNLIELFIDHHVKIGIKNFVLIDNGSSDESVDIIKQYNNDFKIDIWSTNDAFDSFKSCGWRQRMLVYYGINRWYLNLDIDELFVYSGIEDGGINEIIKYAHQNKFQAIESIMLDTYSDKPILSSDNVELANIQKIYKYIDRNTYTKVANEKYKYRIFGGPRNRKFNITPSLQKYPLIYFNIDTVNVNPHFWYPFSINYNSRLVSALLHYKFLPGDLELYKNYVKTGIHWDNSREYKVYVHELLNNLDLSFFDNKHALEYKNSSSLDSIHIINKIDIK